MSNYKIMVKLTKNELRLIARNRGIKNYQNMSREKLLSTLDESEHIFKDFSQNRLKRVAEYKIFYKVNLSK